MTLLRKSALLVALLPLSPLHAQQPDPTPLDLQSPLPTPPSPIFRELDLLRRDGFAQAHQARLIVRLLDRGGYPPPPLQPGQYKLIVNGTERPTLFKPPGHWTSTGPPLVLLTLPPNQPIVHGLALAQARKYFAAQPETLPWKVAVLDADGTVTPFSSSRATLLATLAASDHRKPTFLTGAWHGKAERAISAMATVDAPRIVLAFNPLPTSSSGFNLYALEYGGPETLIDISLRIGAHIYIANVGGPDVLIPGADASGSSTPLNAPFAIGRPSGAFYVPPSLRQTLAASYLGNRSSALRETADDTLGGFSNSLKDLATQIQHNLDDNYQLTFDLTAADRDLGVPDVRLILADTHQKFALTSINPVTSARLAAPRLISPELMAAMYKAANHPIPSPDFRITQHVDYFPLREGLQPVLPMSALVEWIGPGSAPIHLSVAEYVQNTSLDVPVLQREVETQWAGRGLSWERDGHLAPGQYLWRVVLHDETGKVFATSEQKIRLGTPPSPTLAISSLILGASCRPLADASSMRNRATLTPQDRDTIHFAVDPMNAAGCRLKPSPTAVFTPSDTLHTFLRIYPAGKLEKRPPEAWLAHLTLKSANGAVEFQQDLPFTIDSGSGYLAAIALPLTTPTITPGPHTLQVDVTGPGLRKAAPISRTLTIQP